MATVMLLVALTELDRHLQSELDRVRAAGAASDAFRGLYIDESDVILTLQNGDRHRVAELTEARLRGLQDDFGLTELDVEILVAVLAPDLDCDYERVYAFLQNDLSRKRPSVGLLSRLLCETPHQHGATRGCLQPEAPLVRGGIVELDDGPLLNAVPRADARIVSHLLGFDAIDARLLGCASYEPIPKAGSFSQAATADVMGAAAGGTSLVGLAGPYSVGKTDAARLFAHITGRGLLVVDVPTLLASSTPAPEAIRLIFREAQLLSAVIYLSGAHALWAERTDTAATTRSIQSLVADSQLPLLLGSDATWEPPPVLGGRALLRIKLGQLTPTERAATWTTALGDDEAELNDAIVPLAASFRLSARQIEDAVLVARAIVQAEPDDAPRPRHLYAGARAVSGRGLVALGREVVPRADWTHLVLPDDAKAQLRELCSTVRHRDSVLQEWGFDTRLSGGKGVTTLFAGASGTGKTMAAEVIAGELGLALFRIDLAGIVSKWIGETEKNLDRVFEAAWDSNAILFFDEADALFGKRSEVKDSHDRYANLEVSYLLQKMESYEGLAILATNMRNQLDEAFLRRLTFNIVFPLPEQADRARIWAAVWPPELPRGEDVDFAGLASVRLSGGNIKNVVLAAAHLAAADGREVTLDHVVRGLRREYQKQGKQIELDELRTTVANGPP